MLDSRCDPEVRGHLARVDLHETGKDGKEKRVLVDHGDGLLMFGSERDYWKDTRRMVIPAGRACLADWPHARDRRFSELSKHKLRHSEAFGR